MLCNASWEATERSWTMWVCHIIHNSCCEAGTQVSTGGGRPSSPMLATETLAEPRVDVHAWSHSGTTARATRLHTRRCGGCAQQKRVGVPGDMGQTQASELKQMVSAPMAERVVVWRTTRRSRDQMVHNTKSMAKKCTCWKRQHVPCATLDVESHIATYFGSALSFFWNPSFDFSWSRPHPAHDARGPKMVSNTTV